MSLVYKYHPHRFEDVLGQEEAIATIAAQLRRGAPSPLLVSGPPGVGKTTLALTFARAINCEDPAPSGSPCLRCELCRAFDTDDRAHFFLELNAGRLGGKEAAAYIDDIARLPAFGGASRRVVFVDEAHALTGAAEDNLLAVLETPDIAAFVFATSQPERVARALRSRCVPVNLRPLANATLLAHGREICLKENIAFEPDGLAMVAAAAQSCMRDFLLKLDEVWARGPVTVANAGAALDLAWAETVLLGLTALLRGDCPGAVNALTAWRAMPGDKARALRDGLLYLAQRHLSSAATTEATLAAFLGAPPDMVADAAAATAQRAAVLGLRPEQCVVDWGVFWSACAPSVFEEADLALRLREFALRVCPPGAALPDLPPPVPPRPLATPRPRAVMHAASRTTGKTVKSRGAYLTKAHIMGEYRIATLLPQAYGVWFNVRLLLRWRDYELVAWDEVGPQLSALTHELGLRVKDWVGDMSFPLHYLAQHEVDAEGGFVTWLLLHIPSTLLARAREWVAEFLPVPPGVLFNEVGDDLWWVPSGLASRAHWRLLRELWRAVDPDITDVDEAGRRQALKDLLGVPVQAPRAAGVLPKEVRRRFSSSQSIGSGVWRAAEDERFGFVSALVSGPSRRWSALDMGWEILEHKYRADEATRRAARLAETEALLPPGVSPAQDAAREERLRCERESWPTDPLKRPRPQPLW